VSAYKQVDTVEPNEVVRISVVQSFKECVSVAGAGACAVLRAVRRRFGTMALLGSGILTVSDDATDPRSRAKAQAELPAKATFDVVARIPSDRGTWRGRRVGLAEVLYIYSILYIYSYIL
jgi:hypothetical protein